MLPDEYRQHAKLEDKHWWFKARRKIILSILQRFSPQEYQHLAEIGCGTGGNLKFLGQYYKHITGVDISSYAVNHARLRVAGDIIHGEFPTALKTRWDRLEIILLADVIEHIDHDHEFLQELIQSMRPNALLLITAPAHPSLWSPHDLALGHKRRYTMDTFQALWAQQPVVPVMVTPINCLLCPLIFLARWLNKGDDSAESDLKLHNKMSNQILYGVFGLERFWLKYFSLPWGCSYLALLKKVDHDA